MTALVIEILGYILVAAMAGFLLGYLTWGWSMQDRLSEARAEGALEARTSVDGDAGLRAQLESAADERLRLEAELDRLAERLALYEDDPEFTPPAAAPAATPAGEEGAAPGAGAGLAAAGPTEAETADAAAMDPAKSAPAIETEGPAPEDAPDTGLRRLILTATDDEEAPGAATGWPDAGTAAGAAAGTPAAGSGAAVHAGHKPDTAGTGMPQPPAFTVLRQRMRDADEAPVVDQQAPPPLRPDDVVAAPRPGSSMLRRPRPASAGDASSDDPASGQAPDSRAAKTPGDALRMTAVDGSESPVPAGNLPQADSAPASHAGDEGRADAMERPADQTSGARRIQAETGPTIPDGPAAPSTDRPLEADGSGRVTPPKAGTPGDGEAATPPPAEAPADSAHVRTGTRADKNQPPPGGATVGMQARGGDASETDAQAMPADASGAGAPGEQPRPADATLRTRPAAASGNAPGVDDQAPPAATPRGDATRQEALDAGADQTPAAIGAATRANGCAAPFMLLAGPPERPDELRRIRGIGRVMERHLNQQGIWLYRQIAGLTPQGIEWLAETIGGPPDRIRRDRWVEQAQALYRIKYGHEHDAPDV